MTESKRTLANFFVNLGPILAIAAVWVLMVWDSVLDEMSIRRWVLYLAIMANLAATQWGHHVTIQVYSKVFEKYKSHFDSVEVAEKVFLIALKRSGALDDGCYLAVAEDDEGTMYALTAARAVTEKELEATVLRATDAIVDGLRRRNATPDAE